MLYHSDYKLPSLKLLNVTFWNFAFVERKKLLQATHGITFCDSLTYSNSLEDLQYLVDIFIKMISVLFSFMLVLEYHKAKSQQRRIRKAKKTLNEIFFFITFFKMSRTKTFHELRARDES